MTPYCECCEETPVILPNALCWACIEAGCESVKNRAAGWPPYTWKCRKGATDGKKRDTSEDDMDV